MPFRLDDAPPVRDVRALFEEYAGSLGFDLAFQGFDAELASLPGEYAPPHGALCVAYAGDEAAGGAALRRLDAGTGELKRLYVRPPFRGHGLGRTLTEHMLDLARGRGYACVRLDTVGGMDAAQTLYERLGFVDIPPYRENPLPGARFLELAFSAPGAGEK